MTRFLFFADPQLGCYATFSGATEADVRRFADRGMRIAPAPRVEGFEWDALRYARAIEEANRLRPDFVVVGGDMIDDAGDGAQVAEFFRITRSLDSAIPIHWVPGNHDAADDGIQPTPSSLARYREIFGADYYAIERGDAHLVVINTVVASEPQHVPGEWEAQLAFLEATFAAASSAGRRVVLLGHHPLFVERADEDDSYWNVPRARRHQVLSLVRAHGVAVGFAGHMHRNAIARDDGFEMVTSGPVGYPLGDDPSGFRIVEVTRDTLTHEYVALPPPE
jgi:3',5'-cyclic AMP phosphodiesterase CpdA